MREQKTKSPIFIGDADVDEVRNRARYERAKAIAQCEVQIVADYLLPGYPYTDVED